MKYVALLSGGKDSCYNLLHCAKNGHALVAAASLGPEPGKEELDSYMYQTVGQDAIEYVARCLEVPLYRRVISGTSLEQGSEYGSRAPSSSAGVKGDETEDLYELLLEVKRNHPDVEGVSVGAILSNYQRVRVEHVCRRLGLTSLSYLWQRDQGELLSEMVDAGLEAILIKVAGIGLTTKHLGKTLAEMQPTLQKLNNLYGSHICGEGGEYETLTLDCPIFKHRIKLEQTETVIHSDSDFATVAFLRITRASLERKAEPTASFDLAVPPLLEDEFSASLNALAVSQASAAGLERRSESIVPSNRVFWPSELSAHKSDEWLGIGNVQHPSPSETLSLEDEVSDCFEILQEQLSQNALSLSHCAIINLYISSMDAFAAVNAVYSKYFGTSPPARATVAVDLPGPHRVRIDCIARIVPPNGDQKAQIDDRQALHVQSLSYWAPANIGPYSQAIKTADRIFVSGQIGLIPSSLALPHPQDLAMETALCFQHSARVVDAVNANSGGGWEGQMQSAVYWLVNGRDARHVNRARALYDDKNGDVPSLFVAVKALPKGALVEKQIFVHTGRCAIRDEEDGEITMENRQANFETGRADSDDSHLYWEISNFAKNTSQCAIVWAKQSGDLGLASKALATLQKAIASALLARVYYTGDVDLEELDAALSRIGSFAKSYVPCRYVASREDDHSWGLAIQFHCV
ncbi:hypothetical protein BD626DRAFT_479464 [Schizophyllum amplum]|uniref:Diphthine--ammonia ligase n=1 Tax=Schizophyllum amplum TaxID=97359 RepID=A0A550CS94_9AGAR|nr:hypothetical protein BD626DRAFT_479464 [Auriculariopsis ampla]